MVPSDLIAGKAPMMLGVLWTFQFIAFGLVGLRVYARLHVVHTYSWDDYFFNAAVVLLLLYNILCTVASTHGLGQVQTTPPTDDESYALLLVNIAQSVINMNAVLVKLSIACFLLRLVPSNRLHKVILLLPVTIMSIAVIVGMVLLWLACTPIEYSWKLGIPGGYCNAEEEFVVALIGGLCIVLTEVFYASFPWYLIWPLQMPKREKILIGVCMSFGYLSALCSVYRLLALLNLAYYNDTDYLVAIVDLMIWHEADITTQLLCIGVSVCRPLYKDWLNNVVVKIGSTAGSAIRSNPGKSSRDGSGFSVIALQTVGGSSVIPKGSRKGSTMDADGGVVKVERSWRVESDSRSVMFPTDDASEEYILGNVGAAVADPEQQRQA